MGYYRQFELLDPLNGYVPSHPFSSLPNIAERARTLLKDRTRDQILNTAHIIDWFLEEYFYSEKNAYVERILRNGSWELGYLEENARNETGVYWLLDNWPTGGDDPPPCFPTSENTSEFDALRECIGNYALDDNVDVPNGHEWEYFAVLALWEIADTIGWLQWDRTRVIEEGAAILATPIEIPGLGVLNTGKDKETVRAELTKTMSLLDTPGLGHTDDKFRIGSAGESALVALDTVCYAEHLRATEELRSERDQLAEELRKQAHPEHQKRITERFADEIFQQRISIANSKAAIKRHAENRAMKAQVFEWCALHLGKYASMDAAAEAIAGKLVPVTFRTVRTWIGDYRKQERSARRL